jgi:peptidoglycan hydrolase-like protein with peptidoglycan-binding domain
VKRSIIRAVFGGGLFLASVIAPISAGAISITLGPNLVPDNAIIPTEQTVAPATTSSATGTSVTALIQSLYAEVKALEAQIAALSASTTATASQPSTGAQPFTRNLSLYDQGPDVLALQQFLNAQEFPVTQSGPGSPGNETSFFGLATYYALVKYQAANGLPATGYFGPETRAFIANISAATSSGAGSSSQTPNATSSAATSSTTSIPLSLPQLFHCHTAVVERVAGAAAR